MVAQGAQADHQTALTQLTGPAVQNYPATSQPMGGPTKPGAQKPPDPKGSGEYLFTGEFRVKTHDGCPG